MRTSDFERFRRAVQLRDRCRAAAVAAGQRLDVSMSATQAYVAFDAMVDLIREHDRTGAECRNCEGVDPASCPSCTHDATATRPSLTAGGEPVCPSCGHPVKSHRPDDAPGYLPCRFGRDCDCRTAQVDLRALTTAPYAGDQ